MIVFKIHCVLHMQWDLKQNPLADYDQRISRLQGVWVSFECCTIIVMREVKRVFRIMHTAAAKHAKMSTLLTLK